MRHDTRKQEGAARGVEEVRAHRKTRRIAAEWSSSGEKFGSLGARMEGEIWGNGRGGSGGFIG